MISSVNFSNTAVAVYFSRLSVPPYPGRSMATRLAEFCRDGELAICRQIAQLSGNPWIKMTKGLSDAKTDGEPGAALLRKWNLNPLWSVRK
jgi:hypothetical protein